MSNIFRSELIQKYNTKNRAAGIGEWTKRNGVWAMDIRPEPFYKNLDNSTVGGILRDEFTSGVRYIADLWIDVDDVIYNSNNVAAGLYIKYSDGTNEEFVFTGPNKGWNHKKLITNASKTVNRLEIYYYTSMPVYYRWDSYIIPINNQEITNNGQIKTNSIVEGQDVAAFLKGGSVYSNNFYEY